MRSLSHQNSFAEDGGGSADSGGYVPSDASEASEAGDDHTDGDTDNDEFSDAGEGSIDRCEKCEIDFDMDDPWECNLCNQLYCRDCLKDLSLGQEVSWSREVLFFLREQGSEQTVCPRNYIKIDHTHQAFSFFGTIYVLC